MVVTSFVCLTAMGQQPFEDYGYEVKVATLSKGKYVEFFDQDTLVQIGSVIVNTQTGRIVSFITYDTTYSEATLQPELISRWMSPDPLSDEYFSFSPYNFVLNNPINSVDPNGAEVYFLNGEDAAKVLADLNSIFRKTYGLDYDVFKTETRSVKVKKEVTEKVDFDIMDPDTWDGETTKTVTVKEQRTYITTDSEGDFDWNSDKYSAAVFDVLNTTTQFKGEIVPANSRVEEGYLRPTLSEAKGFSYKSQNRFVLSSDLSQAGSGQKKWTFGGTMLHETVNHFHPLGNKEDNTGLQSHFGLPFSRMSHMGAVKTKWDAKELIRLNKLRSKGK